MREYYRQTKPHLDTSEIDYLLNEQYSYDTDLDDEKDVKKKQIVKKNYTRLETILKVLRNSIRYR